MPEILNSNGESAGNADSQGFESLTAMSGDFNEASAREAVQAAKQKVETAADKTFDEISELISESDITVYERLNPTNAKAAKEEFLQNPEMTRPNYEYGNLRASEISKNFRYLQQAESKLDSVELTDSRHRLLDYLIDSNRRKNNFLAANLAYNLATNPESKQLMAEQHREANEALYGKADEGTFYALLKEQIARIDYDGLSDDNKKVYNELLEDIGPIPETTGDRFIPQPETVERFSELVNDFYGGFLEHIPEGKESFSSEDMVDIINEILDEEMQDSNYRARIDPNVSNASAEHKKGDRRIVFPEGKTYTLSRAKALIVHELGTHVLRATTYADDPIDAFSTETGMPDTEEFEEGVAKAVEQAINGKFDPFDSGIDHYINIGLATFKNKNFREVYNIQSKLKQLTGGDVDTVFVRVQRCFRGTGELPNNKDLIYYNGANRVWQYIENHIDDPELFDTLFLTGKTDYLNPEHERFSYEARTKGI